MQFCSALSHLCSQACNIISLQGVVASFDLAFVLQTNAVMEKAAPPAQMLMLLLLLRVV